VVAWLDEAGAPAGLSLLLAAAREANAASDPGLAERLAGRAGAAGGSRAVLVTARAHALRQAVDWRALARLAPGVLAGSLAGTSLATFISGTALLAIFLAFALVAIARMLAAPSSPSAPESALPLPGAALLSVTGAGIGLLCALVGVGGGLLSVPLLATYIPVRRAIGTAAALGLPLAATSAAGYMAAGHSQACGSACLGYVYLPAVLATSLAAVAAAPLGAMLAHRWPVLWLKRAFALLLAIVIAHLALKLLHSAATQLLA